jgi:hypothetical protein
MSQTSGTSQPVISGPASISVVINMVAPVPGITISDTNQPQAGLCSVFISCGNGVMTADGAVGGNTDFLAIDDNFLNCQIALADLIYTGNVLGSDVIIIGVWNQLGMHSSITIPVIISSVNSPAPAQNRRDDPP